MSTETDTTTTVRIDHTADVPCDTFICDQAATWGIRFHQCGHGAAYCQIDHDLLNEAAADGYTVVHSPCEVSNTSWTWREL